MYNSYDFRCLKPKSGVPSEKWPHYDMEAFRKAKTEEDLFFVEEISFDKYFFNLEDPEVLNAMSNGKNRKDITELHHKIPTKVLELKV